MKTGEAGTSGWGLRMKPWAWPEDSCFLFHAAQINMSFLTCVKILYEWFHTESYRFLGVWLL